MKLHLMNVSQLSEATGYDRATIAKYLDELEPVDEAQNLKLYIVPIAIGIILEKSGTEIRWSEIITNISNNYLKHLDKTKFKRT